MPERTPGAPSTGRLCVALDSPSRTEIARIAALLSGEVDLLKIGLEAFVAHGPSLVSEIGALIPVFLDLKLHDIPNTVGGAAAAAARTGASIVNVHAGGGLEMMRVAGIRAREAAAEAGLAMPRVIAVTVLTSLDAAALAETGHAANPGELARRLASLTRRAGLDGVVCSPHEASAIRADNGADFLLVVPGVRPAGSEAGDQKRIATPAETIRNGADVLVVGRPITASADPVAAARAVRAEIASAFAAT